MESIRIMAKSGGSSRGGSGRSPMPPSPITSPKIKHIAGEALQRPSTVPTEQVRELAASVMAHIEPRGKK
jgi:hypothetical protein